MRKHGWPTAARAGTTVPPRSKMLYKLRRDAFVATGGASFPSASVSTGTFVPLSVLHARETASVQRPSTDARSRTVTSQRLVLLRDRDTG